MELAKFYPLLVLNWLYTPHLIVKTQQTSQLSWFDHETHSFWPGLTFSR